MKKLRFGHQPVVVYIYFFPSEIFQPSIENLAQQASPSVEWKKPTLLPARNVESPSVIRNVKPFWKKTSG
jgi:hypothetical protein